MKFGKEFGSQMVLEWQQAYMDYGYLKHLLKDILVSRRRNAAKPVANTTRKGSLRRRLTMYRAFSGLTSRYGVNSPGKSTEENEDEVILVNAVESEGSEGYYQTMFMMSSEEGGDKELLFFTKLDAEFNKVVKFYREKVQAVNLEAEELNKQMDALIALRIRVHRPLEILQRGAQVVPSLVPTANSSATSVTGHQEVSERIQPQSKGRPHMDVIQEVELGSGRVDEENACARDFRPAPLEILDHVKINFEPDAPVSTLKNVLVSQNELTFSKEELRKAEERLRHALIEFYQKLRVLKNYSFLNQLAFSKIMKKYDKITSRNASKSYLDMVDKSYLSSSDEVSKLIEKVEATFIKHFSNGNRRNGMNILRPRAKREKHRITFSLGLFTGCAIALVVAVVLAINLRSQLDRAGRQQFMENIFPLYSLFGFIVLHMIMYAGDTYLWKRFRVNYPFIFGFKQGTELQYREVLLLASGLSVLALAATLTHLSMEMDKRTKSFTTLTELVPLGLTIVLLSIAFCPFNIFYRSSRFFLIQCAWHCLCAPLYKVTLPDFFLADQLTSQVQAIRSLLFYVCYYGWGDFEKRSNKCNDSEVYSIFNIIVAIIPFLARFLQCIRRLIEEKDSMQGLNGLKYLSTIVALVMRTLYSRKPGVTLKILAAASSGITTITNTYWDVIIDWGLLQRNARYPWLRDKLLVPYKSVYFAAIVINILLRLVWMQLVLDFNELPFLHKTAFTAIVACLEILRRGIWNFFRLENEQLNNVGKYRAFKSVPLPFNYEEDTSS